MHHAAALIRAFHVFMVFALLFGYVPPAFAAAPAAPVSQATTNAGAATDLAQAEATFYQALNRLINTPADAPPELHAVLQKQLEAAAAQYDAAKANVANEAARSAMGSPELYSGTASGPGGARASWMVGGNPGGDRATFDQAFASGLQAARASSDSAAPSSEALPGQRGSVIAAAPLLGPSVASGGLRPCGTLRFHVRDIDVHEAGDSGGGGEWQPFYMIVDGDRKDWRADPNDGTVNSIDYEWFVPLNDDGASIFFETGGTEEDPGSDDPIASINVDFNSSNKWGTGDEGGVSNKNNSAKNGDTNYTLYYSISCQGPLFSDLSVTSNVVPNRPVAGDNVTYTFTARNNGPVGVYGAQMVINLPAELDTNNLNPSFDGADCRPSGMTYTCNLLDMPSGASKTVTISVDTAETTIGFRTASASVSHTNTNRRDIDTSDNNTSTTFEALPNADTSVVLDAPALLERNQNGSTTYQVRATVSNGGPTIAPNMRLTPIIPAGVTIMSTAPSAGSCNTSGVCDLGTISQNGTVTVLYTLNVGPTVLERDVMPFPATVGMQVAGSREIDSANNTALANTRLTYWDMEQGVTSPGGPVNAVAYVNGELVVGGAFGVKRWTGSDWSSVGSEGPLGTVHALLDDGNGGYFAAGDFTNIGPRLAHWNGSGWSSVGGGAPNGVIYALARDADGDLYAGGQFSQIGSITTNNVARWDGTAWQAMGVAGVTQGYATAQPQVRAIVADGKGVFVGGLFKTPASNIARWNKETDAWESLGSGISYPGGTSAVHALALLDGRIYVGGRFASAGGQAVGRIAAWDQAQQRWLTLGSGLGGVGSVAVNTMLVAGGELMVGGSFSTAGGISSRAVARWNGANWTAAGSGVDNGAVLSLAGGEEPLTTFVGGSFTTADSGVTSNTIGQYRHEYASLAISQVMTPNPPIAGQPLAIQLTVSNQGSKPVQQVTIRDELPADATYVSATGGTCTDTSGVVTCSVGTLAAGGSAVVTLNVTVAAAITGPFANNVWVGAKQLDSQPDNNRLRDIPDVDAQADVAVTLSAPATATAGETIAYTINARNNGPATATNAAVRFTLPTGGATVKDISGLTCVTVKDYADLVELECQLGAMAKDDTASGVLTFDIRPETQGAHEATATISSIVPDPDAANSTQTVESMIEAVGDLTATLSAPELIFQPEQQVGAYRYQIGVQNGGPSLARAVETSLSFPAETTYVDAPAECQVSGQTVICQAGDLATGESAEFYVDVYVNFGTPNDTALAATLNTQSAATDSAPANNTVTVSTRVSTDPADAQVDLELSLVAPDTVFAGDTALYTLNAFNQGAIAASGVLTVTLPDGATFNPSDSDPACFEDADVNTIAICQLEELAVGQSREWQVSAFISPDAPAGETADVSAVLGTGVRESQPDNNTATGNSTIDTSADLVLSQEPSLNTIDAGETITYTLTIENNGPSLASGVRLSNPQPEGMILDSAEPSQGTCDIVGDEVSCELEDLPAGESITVDVIMTAGSGTVTNVASVQAATADPDEDNNTSESEVEVAAAERETREFGPIEITADVFIELPEGGEQAFGDVWLGEHFHLAGDTDSIVIDGDTLTGEGTLAYLQEEVELFTGDFEGTFTDEEFTITPAEDVEYLLETVSGFTVREFTITQVDLVEGRVDGETSELEIEIEGFERTLNANLFLEPGLTVGGSIESFEFEVSGIEFTVEGAGLTNEGVIADTIEMTLPEEWGGIEASVEELLITTDGLTLGGAEATVPLPDFELSGEEVQVQEASITVVYNGEELMLVGRGTIAIDLPDNEQEREVEFSISPEGEFSAGIDTLSLTLAGATLELEDVGVSNEGLAVAQGTLTLPKSLNESVVTVEDVSITEDGLEIGAAGVAINLPDINIAKGNKVRFSDVVATIKIEGDTYTFGIEATLQLRLPQNKQDIKVAAEVNNDGEFSGSLERLTLNLATVKLTMVGIEFDSEGLRVQRGTVQMPATLGGSSATVTDVVIDDSGLSIGGGAISVPFPDFKLGSSNAIAVSGVKAQISITADKNYKITLSGLVKIDVKSVKAQVKGSVSVDSQGRVTGTIESFKINVAGLEASIKNARATEEGLSVEEASLKTPASWGGAMVAVYNLRISSSGVRIGGGKFAVPEIKAGSISLGSLYGELKEEGNGYSISLGGKFRTPALGGPNCALGVEASMYVGSNGTTTVQMQAFEARVASTDFQLRYVKVGLQGCRIPIGQTGFYLTRVQGSLTLNQNQTIIDLGVTIANDGEWLKGDADMRMQFNPWQMDFVGSVTVFSIFKAAEMKAQMRAGYFSAELRVRALIFNGEASLTAWTDDGGFHLVGRATITLGFQKGSLWEECVVGVCISVPPFTVTVGQIGTEFGEFRNGEWGLKGWAQVLRWRAGFYIDTGGNFAVGNVDRFQLVTPPSVAQVRALASQRNRILTQSEKQLLSQYTFAGDEVIVKQNVGVSTDMMFVMARKGDSPTFTLIDPSGQRIAPDSLPAGVNVVDGMLDDGTYQTLYVVPQAATGEWKMVLTGSGTDYVVRVLGANPAPVLDKLDVVNTSASEATANWTLASDEITTTLDIFLNNGPITTTHTITDENGLLKDVETPMFGGFPVAESVVTTLDGSQSRTQLNLSDVESGTYWVWFNADDDRNPPVRAYAPAPIIVSHPWTGTWKADIAAQDHLRGFDLSWNDHPNPDVDSYRIEVGTQPGIVERSEDIGDQLSTTVDNLTPGTLYYLTLIATDEETGRTSRSETISRVATGPTFDLSANQDATVVSGQSVTTTLSLTTPTDPYPDMVRLSADDAPDGIEVTFDLPENMAQPTQAGTSITVVVSTTSTLSGGVYEVPITGSDMGVQDTAMLRLTVREPRIDVQPSMDDVLIDEQGKQQTLALTAASIDGADGTVDLDLIDVPSGLVYRFSNDTIGAGESAILTLEDTSKLENGTYEVTVRAERGLQQQFIPIKLVVQKPVFSLNAPFTRFTIQKGDKATFAVNVPGEYLNNPVTLRLGTNSSPIDSSDQGFAAAANRSPKPFVQVNANGTGYLIVNTTTDTPAGNYRLVIEGQHGADIQRQEVILTVVDRATTSDLGVSHVMDSRTAVLGGRFTYRVRVANYGPLAAANVQLVNGLPVGSTDVQVKPSRGTCLVQAGSILCDLYTLRRGAVAEVEVSVRISPELAPNTDLISTAEVRSTTDEGYTPDNTSQETITTAAESDVQVSVALQSDETIAGETMAHQVVAWNNGASDATGVKLLAELPADVELVSATPSQGTCRVSVDQQAVSCSIGTLSATPGDSTATVSFETRVKPSARIGLTLAATVDSTTADRIQTNNAASSYVRVMQDVALAISHQAVAPQQAIAGDELTYQLNVVNNGRSDANDTMVIDDLPADMEAQQVAASQGTCWLEAGQVQCELGTLAAQETATVSIRGRINPSARATLRNAAAVESSIGEVQTADNRTQSDTPLTTQSDVSLSITSINPTSFQFVIDNNGLSDAQQVQMTTTIPEGMTVVDVLPTRGTCTQSGAKLTCTIGAMAAKDRVVVSLRGSVRPGLFAVTMQGEVTTSEYDPRTNNNIASRTSSIKTYTLFIPLTAK